MLYLMYIKSTMINGQTKTHSPIPLDDAIREFVAQYDAPKTQASYSAALRTFAGTLKTQNARALTFADVLTFAKSISNRSTRNTYITVLRVFYAWLDRRHVIQPSSQDLANFRADLKPLYHKIVRLPNPITDEELAQLLAAVDTEPLTEDATPAKQQRVELRIARNRAILETFKSALRLSELAHLPIRQIDLRAKQGKVIGKRDKERTFYLTDSAIAAITAYLELRYPNAKRYPDAPLFLRHDQGDPKDVPAPLTPGRIWVIFNELAGRARLSRSIHPHMLRHYVAMKVYEATRDLSVVQEMLGHESITTTTGYARASNIKVKTAFQQAVQ